MGQALNNLQIGDNVCGIYLLRTCELKESKKNTTYLTGTLCNKDSTAEFKWWDYTGAKPANGIPVFVSGKFDSFRDTNYIRISEMREPNASDPAEQYDINELVPSAPISLEAIRVAVTNLFRTIVDKDYKRLVEYVYEKYRNEIENTPAAKSVHHAFRHGLIMHTISIMMMAASIAPIYPFLNSDLLLAAAFLHDIGKPLSEFDMSPVGLVDDYTQEGVLIGHLVSGAVLVNDICRSLEIPEEKRKALMHCILSHHGNPEWGAAVRPQTPEAEMLSKLDQIDAGMETFRTVMANMEPGEISKSINTLGGRRVVKL